MKPGIEQEIETLSIHRLREAIRANRISFPAQVPVFAKHDRPDLQRKVVQLYFLLGWNCGDIGTRYGLIRQRVQQILNTWKRRAMQTGYIQSIPPVECLRGLRSLRSKPQVPVHLLLAPSESPELSRRASVR